MSLVGHAAPPFTLPSYRALFDDQSHAFEERNTTDGPGYRDEPASMGVMVTPAVVIDDRAVPGFRPNTVADLLVG